MAKTCAREVAIAEADLQAQCPALIDDLAQETQDRAAPPKHQAPVAAIASLPASPPELWGALKGTVKVAPGVELTMGTGEPWDAES